MEIAIVIICIVLGVAFLFFIPWIFIRKAINMKPGYYWYKGPSVRDGEINKDPTREWTIVNVWELGISFVGTDWDANEVDSALMAKHGKFVPIEPPK